MLQKLHMYINIKAHYILCFSIDQVYTSLLNPYGEGQGQPNCYSYGHIMQTNVIANAKATKTEYYPAL